MASPPQPYRPSTALLSLGDQFHDPVEAAHFPETRLRFRNDRAASEVGLAHLSDEEWARHFGRFEPLPGTLPRPLALRYHGHQFRHYNPDLGDGRGFTFAQLLDDRGRLMDLGTKGSGQTPWSRFGDGRLTLKGGVREILASEMLEALGVPTCRTLSLIETGEALTRGDEPSPTRSAVMVRLSHGHVRVGSFQRLAFLRDEDGLRRLTGYALRELYGEDGDDPVRLLSLVVERTGRLAARYMAAGFVHGVLNSDNINVTGESFDYGPWRFTPTWDPDFVAAYFDEGGLYAFGRQPEAIGWDVMQLAACLSAIAPREALVAALDGFGPAFQREMAAAMLWRLGVEPRGEEQDRALVQALERALRETQAPLDRFFHDAFGGRLPATPGDAWAPLGELLAPYRPRRDRSHPYWSGEPCSMLIDEVEAIWAAIDRDDDWAPLHAKVAAIRSLGEALA